MMDQTLSMIPQINNLCKSIYFQIKNIASIRDYLSKDVTKTLMTSLVLSRLDYCNSLLSGLPEKTLSKLQLAQNNAARLVERCKKRDHIRPILQKLHWLPVKERIDYKLATTCYKCVNGIGPMYLQDCTQIYRPGRSLRSSSDSKILMIPRKKYKHFGERSFSFLGPKIWNSLPQSIRHSDSLACFKQKLKHHLFVNAFLNT